MRFKRLQNKLTLVVIPEKYASVPRFKLFRGSLWAALFGLALLLGTLAYLYGIYVQAAAASRFAEAWVHDQTDRLKQDITDTNKTVGQLQKESFRLTQQAAEAQGQIEEMQQIPSLWPTLSRTVTSAYGYRSDPFTEKLSFHRGIDIAGKMNDPVFSAADGTVVTVGYDKFHGHNIVIEHGKGVRTWYMHLSEVLVKLGEPVERGQHIGKLGTSGRSTGPHLHYEIISDGKSTDPRPYMPKS